jgi:pyruvate/oxaloacetate carboxyltransferase
MIEQGRQVGITDTTLRDAHQSLIATRMSIDDILSVIGLLDQAGFHSLEVWGGATFDSCMRFLNEDPWERLRKLRRAAPNTKLQMLLRGQNILGYHNYPDDVVTAFVQKSIAYGIDILRIFDALNDPRNLAKAIEVAKKEGGHVQAAISYTISPVHNCHYFAQLAKELRDLGADSICIKDMSGILYPYEAFQLVTAIKEAAALPVQLHCHYSTGMAGMAYLKGIEAGADVIDCAMSPFSLGSSQPAVETFVATLQGSPYDTGIDLAALKEAAALLKEIRKRYKKYDITSTQVQTDILSSQIPGGMISNFMSQLREMKALDKLPEVLAEVPRVRQEMGYPPLVTPTSQIVGSQAALNVLLGERYKQATREVKDYFRGLYGRPPAPVDQEVLRKVIGEAEVITCRPADLLSERLPEARKELGYLMETEDDVLSYVLFPEVAKKFLTDRLAAKEHVELDMVGSDEKIDYCPV